MKSLNNRFICVAVLLAMAGCSGGGSGGGGGTSGSNAGSGTGGESLSGMISTSDLLSSGRVSDAAEYVLEEDTLFLESGDILSIDGKLTIGVDQP